MDRDTFRGICRERRLCWGSVIIEHMTPHTVRTFGRAGYDWLWLDNEHAHHSYETIQEAVRTANDIGMITLLRVTQGEYPLIARALDMGVSGVIVPRVETPEQVRRIVDAAKYPPIGKRGFGFRPSLCGRTAMSMAERVEDQNTRRFLVFQIESRLGVENVEALLDAADGQVDAVIFGPSDFQVELGKHDSPEAPELDAATRAVSAACAARHISNGVPVGSIDAAELWIDRGYNLITFMSDEGFMVRGACEGREALRGLE